MGIAVVVITEIIKILPQTPLIDLCHTNTVKVIIQGVRAKKVSVYISKEEPYSLSPLDMYSFSGGSRPQVPLRALYQARVGTKIEPPMFCKIEHYL